MSRLNVRLAGVAVVLIVVAAVAIDGRALLLGGVHFYQQRLSPAAARIGLRCRFTPTCSRYAEIVIARDGAWVGGWEALARIARCGPWTPAGTIDEP